MIIGSVTYYLKLKAFFIDYIVGLVSSTSLL